MKRYVEVKALCPFVGKPCIQDGWQWNANSFFPCMFYDESVFSKDCYPQEPCMLIRAVDRILSDEKDVSSNDAVIVPWDEERSKNNAKKTKE